MAHLEDPRGGAVSLGPRVLGTLRINAPGWSEVRRKVLLSLIRSDRLTCDKILSTLGACQTRKGRQECRKTVRQSGSSRCASLGIHGPRRRVG